MVDLNQVFGPGAPNPAAVYVAVRLIGEARREMDKMVGLIESGLVEADTAAETGGTESAAWARAINIGQVLRDMAIHNAQRLGTAERRLSLLALEEGRR